MKLNFGSIIFALFAYAPNSYCMNPIFQCRDALSKIGKAPISTLGWASDIHLDFADRNATQNFISKAQDSETDAIVISGDISTANRLSSDLRLLGKKIQKPILFVLGNHDFYRGNIIDVRNQVAKISDASNNLIWLPHYTPISLTPKSAIVGVDGWGDATVGNRRSRIEMTDFSLIKDLSFRPPAMRNQILNQLGLESAALTTAALSDAFKLHDFVILVTHVAPFEKSYSYQGKSNYPEYQPFFVNGQMGRSIVDFMSFHPEKKLLVLCGHGHYPAFFSPLPNVQVYTAPARYGNPTVHSLIEVAK